MYVGRNILTGTVIDLTKKPDRDDRALKFILAGVLTPGRLLFLF